MNDHPAQPVERPVGLETEYGILKPGDPRANPVALASRLVAAYGAVSRPALTGPDDTPAPAMRLENDLSIQQIATAVGYSHQSSFTYILQRDRKSVV